MSFTMKNKNLIFAGVIMISMSMNSCGVMFGGSKYNGTIIAKNHPDAEIYVNGEKAGIGTVSGSYYRNKPLTVAIKSEGCEPHEKTYTSVFRSGNFILSAITWGLIGIGVDMGTGAAYKPNHKGEADINKENDKNYTFTVELPNCER